MTDLPPELQQLIDRQEILECVHRYARALDRHDDELLASVFHEDAVDNHGPWIGGRADFVGWANHECHDALAAHMHHITTHTCEIGGDVAHAETYVMFVHRPKPGHDVIVGGGRYIDRFEKRDGEWRIALRRVVMDLSYIVDGSIFETLTGYPTGTQDTSDLSYARPLELTEELRAQLEQPGVATA
jgi:hypothetical protein